MQVLIMRHGDAAIEAASDAVRPLTQCGREESTQIALWLQQQGLEQQSKIECVLVSPYLRARQTLEVIRGVLALPAKEEILPELTPGGDVAQVASYLQALAKQGVASVILVSHLPLVGYLVSELSPGETPPMFCPSAVAQVSLDENGKGTFDWQCSPSQLMAKA